MIEDNFYWYGIAAAVYLVTCWVFAVVRAVHNCGTPKERRDYIWPDRKMQVAVYLSATVLLPYVLNPKDEAAWILFKSYFPGTYYFYCGALIFCFFGTVKQWKMWKTTNLVAAIVTFLAIFPLVLHAWLPSGLLGPGGVKVCSVILMVVSILAMIYAGVAMWQVRQWMKVSRDVNYSNPEDFPTEYAHRMWMAPIILTPFLWPGYITDSQTVMAVMCVPLAIFNIALLLNVMPVWRRAAILSGIEEEEMEVDAGGTRCELLQPRRLPDRVCPPHVDSPDYPHPLPVAWLHHRLTDGDGVDVCAPGDLQHCAAAQRDACLAKGCHPQWY